jgi:hypothetical protein
MASSAHHAHWIREAAVATPGPVIGQRAMIAMQLTSPDLSRRQAPGRSTAAIDQDGQRSGMLPADQPPTAPDEPATVTAQFQPLDPGIVNDAIPAFFIGRNKEGFWVARDVKGQIGGIFLLENSAVSFARRNSRPAGCATIYPHGRIELDLENKGNPFAVHLVSMLRLTKRPRRRIAALIARMRQAVKRRLGDFHAF